MSVIVARPEDAATLVALGAAIGREPEGWLLNTDGWRTVGEERRYLRALRRHPDAAVYVAEDDGAIVGRLSVARDPHSASRHVADLGLMVAASHRRRGIGAALLEQAAAWARESGVSKLELHVFPWNEPAIKLYEGSDSSARGCGRRTTGAATSTSTRSLARRLRRALKLAAEHRGDGTERDPRVREVRLARRHPLQGEAGQEQPRSSPDGCCTAFHSSIVTPIEYGYERAGQARREKTGRDLVEDGRDGNRERGEVGTAPGREAARPPPPAQVETSEPVSAAAIARCSAPWRRKVPPRKSQATISSVVRIPAASAAVLGSATKPKGRSSAVSRTRRSRPRATPRPRASGAIEDASWSRPRTSRTRDARERRAGISPSCRSPSLVANAQ